MGLRTLQITHAKEGLHSDGGGLYLQVSKGGGKSWIFRYQIRGRRRAMGLGSLIDVSPAQARARAEELKQIARKGRDPLEEHRVEAERLALEEKAQAKAETRSRATFRMVSSDYIAAHEAGWKNAKHAKQWKSTLETYVYPMIGDLPIHEVTTQHVLDILNPIWTTKTETASRVRSRIELIVSFAKARGWFEGENPAVWRGHLAVLMPASSKVKRVKHHPALSWRKMGAFMSKLREMPGISPRALEFTILTAARSGEVRGARWSEIDLKDGLWVVPAARMKAGKAHRVPLSDDAKALLKALPSLDDDQDDALVFPGPRSLRPLSDMSLSAVLDRMGYNKVTVHGFRSAFRDWAAESTLHHPDIVELALAHTISNKVEAAYRRGDLLGKRRQLMAEWAAWCSVIQPDPQYSDGNG